MFKDRLISLKGEDLLRTLRTAEFGGGVKAFIAGRPCTQFCTNDYLGLSHHPDVTAAVRAAVDETGFGAGSAPLIAGHTRYHKELREYLARFKGSETALLFGSGYLANVGIIPALAGEGDVILSDSLNHASIIDGCRLSRADVKVYRHADPSSLEASLKSCGGYKRRWVVTEGVFGMDGEVAPLPDILHIAGTRDAGVIIDDAHATGTIGKTGRGTLEHFGLEPGDGVIQMGTLGKALGSYGAFVAGTRVVIDWLVNSARSFMFSTALPPAACAAAIASLRVIERQPERTALLRKNADHLRSSLLQAGFKVLGDGTPIVPLIMGSAHDAVKLASSLMDAGYYAPAIRPPTVPEGMSRLRFTVSSLHTADDIEGLVEALLPSPPAGEG